MAGTVLTRRKIVIEKGIVTIQSNMNLRPIFSKPCTAQGGRYQDGPVGLLAVFKDSDEARDRAMAVRSACDEAGFSFVLVADARRRDW